MRILQIKGEFQEINSENRNTLKIINKAYDVKHHDKDESTLEKLEKYEIIVH